VRPSSRKQPRAGTFITIIAHYKASPEFTGLAPSTRRSYLACDRGIIGFNPCERGGRDANIAAQLTLFARPNRTGFVVRRGVTSSRLDRAGTARPATTPCRP